MPGGSEYNLAVETLNLVRAGCWSHLRRYFFNAAVVQPEANAVLQPISDLFLIERELDELSASERLAVRKERRAPLVDSFYAWVRSMSQKERPKSKLGEALGYAISQEARMRVFLANGHVAIHDHLAELLLRQPMVGRKNWLFSGSEGGAEARLAGSR